MARLDVLPALVSAAFPSVVTADPWLGRPGPPTGDAGGMPAHPGTADR